MHQNYHRKLIGNSHYFFTWLYSFLTLYVTALHTVGNKLRGKVLKATKPLKGNIMT
jgi:hypothetical protein